MITPIKLGLVYRFFTASGKTLSRLPRPRPLDQGLTNYIRNGTLSLHFYLRTKNTQKRIVQDFPGSGLDTIPIPDVLRSPDPTSIYKPLVSCIDPILL